MTVEESDSRRISWLTLVHLLDRAQDFVMMAPGRSRQILLGLTDAVGESVSALRR